MESTFAGRANVADGSKAPFCLFANHFRSTPINGHHLIGPAGTFRAKSGSRTAKAWLQRQAGLHDRGEQGVAQDAQATIEAFDEAFCIGLPGAM